MARCGRRALHRDPVRRLGWGAIGLALGGLGLMVQPLTHGLFRVGFRLLFIRGIGTVSTTFWRTGDVTWPDAAKTLLWVVVVHLEVVGIGVVITLALL